MSSLQPFFTNYNYTILKALIIKHPSFLLFSTRAVIVVVEWRERERESLLWKMRFRFEEYLASDEPNNKGFFEDLTFIGPSTGSLLQLKSGGADLNLKNWYVSQIGSFLSLEEDAFHRIDSIQVNPIYFTGSAVNLITPTSLNTDFIIQSENQGAGSGAEKPIWLNWTN